MNFKRQNNFWEPIYDPSINSSKFVEFDWNLANSKGPKLSICSAGELNSLLSSSTHYFAETATFDKCDFEGKFNFCRITFKKCIFEKCDFGRTEWENVKFSNCTFIDCSFSTVKFSNTQFIRCSWKNIGISAEEMNFENVLISNPKEFITSAYTNTDEDVLVQKGTSAAHQLYRLEKTKSKTARKLLSSIEKNGDEDMFYEAVMTNTNQISIWKSSEAKYFLKYGNSSFISRMKWFFLWAIFSLEKIIISMSGKINGWGGQVGRAGLCGLGIILLFSACYYFLGVTPGIGQSTIAALEITLLVGFTKYTSLNNTLLEQTAYAVNVVLGLWWYAVFVPTVINRISRVRQ